MPITPGPWAVTVRRTELADTGEVEDEMMIVSNGKIIAWVSDYEGAEDDASAIAAVPGLIDALEAVKACPLLHDEKGHLYIKVDARAINGTGALVYAALAKAKGEGA